jgi:hypothetical protein
VTLATTNEDDEDSSVRNDATDPPRFLARNLFGILLDIDDFVRSREGGRHTKTLQMQGARILRNEAYMKVRCSDER